jgi:hypothetical protein
MLSIYPLNLHLVPGKSISPATVTLLGNAELHALALWQTDPRLLATNDADSRVSDMHVTIGTELSLQDVRLAGGELVVDSVLNVDNVETSVVTLTVSDDTNTTLHLC